MIVVHKEINNFFVKESTWTCGHDWLLYYWSLGTRARKAVMALTTDSPFNYFKVKSEIELNIATAQVIFL